MALFFATQVSAMTPTLSLNSNGTGTFQVTVYGDPNSNIILDYYSGGQLMGAGIIGYTNYSGYYSNTISAYNYNVPAGAEAVVIVDGQESSGVTWPVGYGNTNSCYPYSCGYDTGGQISLSQSSLSLSVGQSGSVTVYNSNTYNNYNQYTVTNNASGVVNGTINGNVITVYADSAGTGSLNICSTSGGCATLYVTVSGYNNTNYCYQYPYNCNTTNYCYQTYPYNCNNGGTGYYSTPVSVSNSNVQLTVGSTGSVALYGGSTNNGYGYNSYYVSSNNSSVASATVNGSTLTIYGTNPGTSSISVCSSNGGGQCASVSVTVTAQYQYPVYNNQYNSQYYYGSPYTYPPYSGNWQYSYSQNCWERH